jgi:hypothetical protein
MVSRENQIPRMTARAGSGHSSSRARPACGSRDPEERELTLTRSKIGELMMRLELAEDLIEKSSHADSVLRGAATDAVGGTITRVVVGSTAPRRPSPPQGEHTCNIQMTVRRGADPPAPAPGSPGSLTVAIVWGRLRPMGPGTTPRHTDTRLGSPGHR